MPGIGRVFVGHTPQWGGLRRYGNVYAIDTGAVFGWLGMDGHLTCVNIERRPRGSKGCGRSGRWMSWICRRRSESVRGVCEDGAMSRKRKPSTSVEDGEFRWNLTMTSTWIRTGWRRRTGSGSRKLAERRRTPEEVNKEIRERYGRYLERVRKKKKKEERERQGKLTSEQRRASGSDGL